MRQAPSPAEAAPHDLLHDLRAPDAGFRLVAGRPHGLQRLLIASGRPPTGQPGPMHLHAGDEVLRILSGELVVRVGDQQRSCRTGDLIIVPPSTLHGFRVVSETVMDVAG